MMRAAVLVMLLCATCCAALECSGGIHEFENSPRPSGWNNADQRFGAKKEKEGHHHIKCESAKTLTAGNLTYTRATMEFKLAEIGIGGQWGEELFKLLETRFRVHKVNGVHLSTEEDGNSKATTVIPDSYKKYMVCSSDGDSFMEFGDALVLESTYAGIPGLKVTAFGFRSEDAKQRVLDGNQLFAVDANMGSCRMEIVVEIPVPANGDLSFEVQFYVHGSQGGKSEEEINNALKTKEVGNEIVVTYDDAELMGMSTGLVCKNTKLAVPSSNVTRERVPDYSQGEVWKYSVNRSAVTACGSVVFDPRMTPLGAPTLTDQPNAGTDQPNAGKCGWIAMPLPWIFAVGAANVLAVSLASVW